MRTAPALAALALVPAICVVAPNAAAQDGEQWMITGGNNMWMGSFGGPSEPITRRQLDRYADILRLDDTQREQAQLLREALLDQHLETWVRFAEKQADAQHSARYNQDWQSMQAEMEKLAEERRKETERFMDTLLEDLSLLLSREQLDRMDQLEQARRREETLTKWACTDDETFDLIAVVDTLDLDEADMEPLRPMLDDYASTLDSALASRNRHLETVAEAYRDYTEAQEGQWSSDMDADEMMKRQEDMVKAQQDVVSAAKQARSFGERVGAINRRYAELIVDHLPSYAREEFEDLTDTSVDDNDPWRNVMGGHVRSKMMIQTLRNMESTITAMNTWISAGGGEMASNYARLARQVQPLSVDQLDELELIEEDLERELEALEDERPNRQQPDADSSFSVGGPAGRINLTKVDPNDPSSYSKAAFAGMMGGGDEDAMQDWMEQRAEVDERYITRIRDTLTIHQRAIIAYQ